MMKVRLTTVSLLQCKLAMRAYLGSIAQNVALRCHLSVPQVTSARMAPPRSSLAHLATTVPLVPEVLSSAPVATIARVDLTGTQSASSERTVQLVHPILSHAHRDTMGQELSITMISNLHAMPVAEVSTV